MNPLREMSEIRTYRVCTDVIRLLHAVGTVAVRGLHTCHTPGAHPPDSPEPERFDDLQAPEFRHQDAIALPGGKALEGIGRVVHQDDRIIESVALGVVLHDPGFLGQDPFPEEVLFILDVLAG